MLKFEANLVGMHFRPPAKDLVNMLPSGAELLAQRQPDNPHDENAIQVFLLGFCEGGQNEKLWQQFVDQAREECTVKDVEVNGNSEDVTDEEALAEAMTRLVDPMPLGYICNGEKTGGKKADIIAPLMDAAAMPSVPCKLSFNEKGGPVVVWRLDFKPEEHQPNSDPNGTNANLS